MSEVLKSLTDESNSLCELHAQGIVIVVCNVTRQDLRM